MRTTYETEGDREKESALAKFYSQHSGLTLRRCPRFYPCDWAALNSDGELTALIEIKARTRRYSTYMVSLHKVTALLSMAEVSACKPLLLVWFEDSATVMLANLATTKCYKRWGGRDDRGDDQDQEPVLKFWLDEFQNLGKLTISVRAAAQNNHPKL